MNNTRVSIIIATFNSGKTLRTALQSVMNQTYQDWECIVVDGASKDGTIEIVKEFEAQDSRFRHVSEPDKGIYDAFNKGWKMAKGEWIHYLGDDDRLTVDGMDVLMQQKLDDVDVVTGHCYIEKIDGAIKPNYSVGFGGCHQGKLTRRSILQKFMGFDMRYSVLADKDLMLRMEKGGARIKNVDVFVAYFAMTGMSQRLDGLFNRSKEYYYVCKNDDVSNPLWMAIRYYIKVLSTITYRNLRRLL